MSAWRRVIGTSMGNTERIVRDSVDAVRRAGMCGQRQHRSRRYDIGRRENPDMRASDADREHVAQLLRDGAGDGRLDMDELSERLESVYAARTFGELNTLTKDLPVAAPQPSRELARPRHRPRAFVWISVMLVAIWALT